MKRTNADAGSLLLIVLAVAAFLIGAFLFGAIAPPGPPPLNTPTQDGAP